MDSARLEAFSDAVMAIIITIMVLELKIPHEGNILALKPLLPILLSYILSFINLGIYWAKHHHLFKATEQVSGSVLWANLHLLFWLSLIPFVSGWMGENHFAPTPTAMYGFVLLMSSVAYWKLQSVIVANHSDDSVLVKAIGNNFKGKLTVALYAVSIPATLISQWLAGVLFVLVAMIWLVPERRIEESIE